MTKAQVRKLETVLAEVQALQHEVKDYRIQKMLGDGKTDLLRALHALRHEYPAGIATLAEEQGMKNEALPKLLRAIAAGSQAKENRHDVILNAAADELEFWRSRPGQNAIPEGCWDGGWIREH